MWMRSLHETYQEQFKQNLPHDFCHRVALRQQEHNDTGINFAKGDKDWILSTPFVRGSNMTLQHVWLCHRRCLRAISFELCSPWIVCNYKFCLFGNVCNYLYSFVGDAATESVTTTLFISSVCVSFTHQHSTNFRTKLCNGQWLFVILYKISKLDPHTYPVSEWIFVSKRICVSFCIFVSQCFIFYHFMCCK